ncbi:hypothetical protein CMV_002154 [Castanea mollissima]|uniref:60S acidic ribosomal protein P1 n=1 Tax=Castanea mollissima TaxID=60419 RepID=A0A8J4RV06_9ROSI|nr:hypothetical protein CMV_002154 [Castanea mollissima]
MGVKVVDLFTALQKRDDWMDACFTDGIHLSAEGGKVPSKFAVAAATVAAAASGGAPAAAKEEEKKEEPAEESDEDMGFILFD